MKTVQNIKTSRSERVTDAQAARLVGAGTHKYVPKSFYKLQVLQESPKPNLERLASVEKQIANHQAARG